MRRMAVAVAWLSVAGAVVGFYQPWARLDLREPALAKQLKDTAGLRAAMSGLEQRLGRVTVTIRRGAETIAGDLSSLADIPTAVSGAEIPRMIRQERAQLALALAEIFTNTPSHLGLKSHAVYLVPGVALLCGALLTLVGRRRPPIAWGIALFCGGISGAGFWTLLTMKTQTHLVAITIGRGLWLSCWAYAGLAAAAILFWGAEKFHNASCLCYDSTSDATGHCPSD
ncbi:MAG: hypothetical protein HYY59_04950 [Candidatus Omnitrophica bacterium]|nr:hypothetical protein [Candidatus Omnitrophota bacterium]